MGRRNVPIQHFLAKRLTIIGAEEIDGNKALIKAVNGWLIYSIVMTLDVDYEDIESLNNLDITNIMRCGKHAKNCVTECI